MKKFVLSLIATVSTFATNLFAANPFGEALSGVTKTAEKVVKVPVEMVEKMTTMFSFTGMLSWLKTNWTLLAFCVAIVLVLLFSLMFVLGRLSSRKRG